MEPLIETRLIRKRFGKRRMLSRSQEQTSAVNGVSLRIQEGSALGLIGESGSGKSTLGRMVAGLEKPTEGTVVYRGREISALSLREMRPLRRHIQMIFQNSGGVFDPCYTIGDSISEVLRNNGQYSHRECEVRVGEILEQVGLDASYAKRVSHELSGGQRQRANIARALVLHPEFVVCDEPVSSLDYSLRKQVLTLLNDLRVRFGLTYLFITHDLHSVPYVCDSMAIMYAGQILELLDLSAESMETAIHPYTRLLLSSAPVKDPSDRCEKERIRQEEFLLIPDERRCCRFHIRCPERGERCGNDTPTLKHTGKGHMVACHRI